MKQIALISMLITLIVFQSCSDSTSSSTSIQISAEINTPLVSIPAKVSGNSIQVGGTVDSVRVTRVRMLLSRLILHTSSGDSSRPSTSIKTVPFIFDATPDAANVIATTDIPAGTYQNLKYEIHKFSTAEIEQYKSDPNFAPFVTADRNTVVVEGSSFKSGVGKTFAYNTDVNTNLSLNLQTPVTIESGSTGKVALQFQPSIPFKNGSSVLDPSDTKNKNDIDNLLKVSIKAVKK